MDTSTSTPTRRRKFAVVFVIGAPGSGKGTTCGFLARRYGLRHFSVGDGLRAWMDTNRDTPLAAQIRDKLDHQGFLTSAELNPFLGLAVEEAVRRGEGGGGGDPRGILIDGFPRCEEQLGSWARWPFQERLPLGGGAKPDVVLSLGVTRENAEARYLARARDSDDSAAKFGRRYDEYLDEGRPVEQHYREAGMLIDIDNNGTKEENLARVEKILGESALWKRAVVDQDTESFFVL